MLQLFYIASTDGDDSKRSRPHPLLRGPLLAHTRLYPLQRHRLLVFGQGARPQILPLLVRSEFHHESRIAHSELVSVISYRPC